MLTYIMSFLPWWMNWFTATTGGLGIGLGAAWFFGLMPVVTAILSPVLGAVAQGAVWLWQTIFWPGLKDILDDWVTVVTVLSMGGLLWFAVLARYEVYNVRMQYELATCKTELVKLQKTMPEVEAPSWSLPWPWKW